MSDTKIKTAAPLLLLVAAFALVGGAIIPTGVVLQLAYASNESGIDFESFLALVPEGTGETVKDAVETTTGTLRQFGLDEEADRVEDTIREVRSELHRSFLGGEGEEDDDFPPIVGSSDFCGPSPSGGIMCCDIDPTTGDLINCRESSPT